MFFIKFWSGGDKLYTFLSNFYLCPVKYKDILFKSAEHAYQWARLENKSDFEGLAELSAAEVKRRIHQFKKVSDWNSVKLTVMREVTAAKFDQNEDLRKKLMRLYIKGGVFIHEVKWNDTFWGVLNGEGLNAQGILIAEYAWNLLCQKIGMKSRVLNNVQTGIFIGRPSKWGNPIVLTQPTNERKRIDVIRQYSQYLSENFNIVKEASSVLLTENVSCFCAPAQCHGEVLLAAAYLSTIEPEPDVIAWLQAFCTQGYSVNLLLDHLQNSQNKQESLF